MIVFDVISDGQVTETIRPQNQRTWGIFWCMVDQMEIIRAKYGTQATVRKRVLYAIAPDHTTRPTSVDRLPHVSGKSEK